MRVLYVFRDVVSFRVEDVFGLGFWGTVIRTTVITASR